MKRIELKPEAEDLVTRLEGQQRCREIIAANPEISAIIQDQGKQISHLLSVISRQGATIRRLEKELQRLSGQPPKLKIESVQALYTILQEAINRHTGIAFVLGKMIFPEERIKTSNIRTLLQEIQSLRLADHSTPETLKFLTRFIPRLAGLVERFPSAETIIPLGLIDKVFAF